MGTLKYLLALLLVLMPVSLFAATAGGDAITSYYATYAGVNGVNPLATNSMWRYHPDFGDETFDYGSGAVPYRTNEYGPYTHIVWPALASSTDSGNTYGADTNSARDTIPYPLPPGSVVQVWGKNTLSGNGAPSGNFVIRGDGTDKPIFVTGINPPTWTTSTNGMKTCVDPSDMTLLTSATEGMAIYLWGTNIYVQNMWLTNNLQFNTRPLLHGYPCEKIVVRSVVGDGNGTSGNELFFSAGGSSGSDETHFTTNSGIFRCEARNYGEKGGAVQNDACMFIAGQNVYTFHAIECNGWGLGGDGWRIGADQGDAPSGRDYVIAGGWYHDNRENGGDVKQARYAIISGNNIWNIASTASSNGEGITSHYVFEEVWFFNNVYSNCVVGLYGTDAGTNSWSIGDIFVNNSQRGAYLRSGGRWKMLNSTFYNNPATGATDGSLVDADTAGTSTFSGANLLFVSNASDINFTTSTIRGNSTVANFMFGPSPEILWSSTYTTGASWDSAVAVVSGVIDEDPLLSDPANGNYRLTSSSPTSAKTGGSATLLATAESEFVVHFGRALNMSDPDGTPYNQSTPHIGSYVYVAPGSLAVGTLTVGTLTVGP